MVLKIVVVLAVAVAVAVPAAAATAIVQLTPMVLSTDYVAGVVLQCIRHTRIK